MCNNKYSVKEGKVKVKTFSSLSRGIISNRRQKKEAQNHTLLVVVVGEWV